MLLSPGHSPRHLSTPSPAPSVSSDSNPNPNSSLVSNSDTRKRRRSPTVLDEDSYVAAIEKIIERDYFPDIPKLRDRLDWLQAVRTHDPVLIRDAQLKIIERRRLRKAGDSSAADASIRSTTATPRSSFFRTTSVTPSYHNLNKDHILNDESVGGGGGSGDGGEQVDVSLPLDEFFRKYTSEDNESFSKILEKVNRKKKEKYGYLLECGETEGDNLIENGNKREISSTDGYGTSNQPVSTLEGWKYTPKNLLMYHPADRGEMPLTEEERNLRLKGMTKEILKSNTRFNAKAMGVTTSNNDDDNLAVLYMPVVGSTPNPISNRDGDKVKKYDLEDMKKTPNRFYVESEKKADNGYNFVKTPSPAPGVDDSPFITWGEIEGTPLRLEPEDTPIDIGGSGNGPQFKIPMPPTRDVKAHSLSREAAKKIRERSKMFQKPPLPSPVRGGSASPSARVLSSAAQKFMRSAIAKSSQSIDESLRASYRSSSPGISTPKSTRSTSRLGRDSMGSRSPSVREGSNPPW